MEHRTKLFFLAFGSGVIAVAAILFGLVGPAEPVRADPGELYVAPGGDCGGASPCYDNVQAAVDAAAEGDAGVQWPGSGDPGSIHQQNGDCARRLHSHQLGQF
jgi:hypothetical protein